MRHYRANSATYKAKAAAWSKQNWKARKAILQRNIYGWDPPYACPDLCELCQKRKARCIDHDHETGQFRGWLCHGCNTGIGALGDNVAGLLRAVAYLLRRVLCL